MFRVIEYLAKSLKIIRNGTILKLFDGFLFAFYTKYGRIFSRFWDIQRQRMACVFLQYSFGFFQGH